MGYGDYFTLVEDRERVSYFNFNVLKKVDNLRRRGRNLTIKVTLGGLVEPAFLKVNDDERPVVCIDAYQVFKAEDVQLYWERAKAIIKRMKLNTSFEEPRFAFMNLCPFKTTTFMPDRGSIRSLVYWKHLVYDTI